MSIALVNIQSAYKWFAFKEVNMINVKHAGITSYAANNTDNMYTSIQKQYKDR